MADLPVSGDGADASAGRQPTQAMGTGPAAAADAGAETTGRTGGGESGGGAYKDKSQVKGDPHAAGFMGHGGQSDQAYRGPGDETDDGGNENATTR